jgi:hypothetical protein
VMQSRVRNACRRSLLATPIFLFLHRVLRQGHAISIPLSTSVFVERNITPSALRSSCTHFIIPVWEIWCHVRQGSSHSTTRSLSYSVNMKHNGSGCTYKYIRLWKLKPKSGEAHQS